MFCNTLTFNLIPPKQIHRKPICSQEKKTCRKDVERKKENLVQQQIKGMK